MSYLPPPPVGGYGVGPYATSSMPLPPMRSLRGLWISLLVLFTLIALVDIAGAGAFFSRGSLLDDVSTGRFPTFQEASDADDSVTRAMGAHIVLVIVIAVVFIVWQFRHAKNAQALGERGGLGPGWAIGGWFVPIANYVLPAVQLHQSSRLSDPAVAGQPGAKGKGAPIVIVWMVLLALASLVFVGGGGLRSTDDEGNVQLNSLEDAKDAASADQSSGSAMVLYVGAAIAAGLMVRSLSTKQTVAYEARRSAGPAGPYGGPAAAPPGPWGAPTPAPPGQWGSTPPSWSQPAPPPPPATPPETPWGSPPS